ncbi:MAG TPA: hypothetical protein VLA72_20520 [Anaerolineales bacterium]|nr:hypothetical protein [Anaerolineales bacterium]
MNHFSMEQISKEKYTARIKEGLHEQGLKRSSQPKNPAARNLTRLVFVATVLILVVRFVI